MHKIHAYYGHQKHRHNNPVCYVLCFFLLFCTFHITCHIQCKIHVIKLLFRLRRNAFVVVVNIRFYNISLNVTLKCISLLLFFLQNKSTYELRLRAEHLLVCLEAPCVLYQTYRRSKTDALARCQSGHMRKCGRIAQWAQYRRVQKEALSLPNPRELWGFHLEQSWSRYVNSFSLHIRISTVAD